MPSNYGAFDENGNPIRSSVNPAFTGAPPAPPVLRELPTPAPDRLFNPNAMPQLPSVQPQTPAPSLLRRAADFVMPPAGAATLDQPGQPPAQPTGWFRERGATNTGLLSQTIPGKPQGYDPARGYDPSINIGDQIAQQGAKDKWLAQQAAAAGQPAPAPLGSMPPINDQLRGFGSDVAQGAKDFAIGLGKTAGAISDVAWNMPVAGVRGLLGSDATNARQLRMMGAEPADGQPDAPSAARRQYPTAPLADSESYLGAPSLPQPGIRHYPTAPLAGSKSAGAAPELQPGQASTADYVPTYQMGPGGALTLAMPGGGTAELTPGPGANRLGVRVSELAGQKLGGGQFESDAQVAARRPDLYGADGRPLLADAFGHAVDQGLARRAAEIDARNALAAAVPNTRDLVDRGNALLDQAGKAKLARNQRDLSAEGQALLSLAAQQQTAGRNAQLQIQQDATTRRGQDMQLLGRERRNPVSVKTADGGEVLFDPGSGQWLQPPGAQGGGLGKQDADRLKGITGHIGKAMGMDSAANPIDAATGAAYTAASRIGGGAYMATRGVRQFAGYTDADFAGIGQDVAAGRATIRTGKDGMAYAIYHGEDGKAYGVPIGPAENYANFQPAAGQPAAAR